MRLWGTLRYVINQIIVGLKGMHGIRFQVMGPQFNLIFSGWEKFHDFL